MQKFSYLEILCVLFEQPRIKFYLVFFSHSTENGYNFFSTKQAWENFTISEHPGSTWILIARFSNSDDKNWMRDDGHANSLLRSSQISREQDARASSFVSSFFFFMSFTSSFLTYLGKIEAILLAVQPQLHSFLCHIKFIDYYTNAGHQSFHQAGLEKILKCSQSVFSFLLLTPSTFTNSESLELSSKQRQDTTVN